MATSLSRPESMGIACALRARHALRTPSSVAKLSDRQTKVMSMGRQWHAHHLVLVAAIVEGRKLVAGRSRCTPKNRGRIELCKTSRFCSNHPGSGSWLSVRRSRDLLALCSLCVLLMFLTPEGALAHDTWPTSGELAIVAEEVVHSVSTPWGIGMYGTAHLISIVACFPGTIAFEVTAGAIFGFLPGTLLVAAVKSTASLLTFTLVQSLGHLPVARWLQGHIRQMDSQDVQWAARLRVGIKRGGFRFCALARLSPIPSWVNNYILPITGVPLETYLPASIVGMLLPLATNVYGGATAASLAIALNTGASSKVLGGLDLALPMLSAISGVAVVHQLASSAFSQYSEDGLDEDSTAS